MTRFERDSQTIQNDVLEAREILERRKTELHKLEDELKRCKNGFRAQCLIQEIKRLTREYSSLDALV